MYETRESEAIRQRMEELRCDLDEDVQEIVEGARDMGDWRTYVRTYPWACLGAAMAVGYLIVPRRVFRMQPDAQTIAELAKQSRLLATSAVPTKSSARGILLAIVGNLVLRGVSSFVGQQAGKLFASEAVDSQQGDQP